MNTRYTIGIKLEYSFLNIKMEFKSIKFTSITSIFIVKTDKSDHSILKNIKFKNNEIGINI